VSTPLGDSGSKSHSCLYLSLYSERTDRFCMIERVRMIALSMGLATSDERLRMGTLPQGMINSEDHLPQI